jgi:hypothetical protein
VAGKTGLVLILLAGVFARTGFAESLTADQIIEKFIAASEDSASTAKKNCFGYRRSSQVDYLDSQGKTKNKVERIYQVKPVNGKPMTKLLLINGKPAVEREDSRRSPARQTGEKSRTLHFDKELMEHYQFTLAEPAVMDGRRLHVLRFSAKSDAESDGFFERLLNAMQGTLWIDQEDFQLVKADVHLGQKISFFGGLAGAIEKLDLTLVQKRLEPGVWLPELTLINFNGRKLFSDMKFRCIESCAQFEKTSMVHNSDSRPEAKRLN